MDEVTKTNKKTTEEMEVDLSTPTDLPVTSDQERDLLRSPTPENKPRKLGGAARKRLSRLLKSGVPYKSALHQILEQREQGQPQERKHSPSVAGTSKRLRSNDDSPEQEAKKPCSAESVVTSGETDLQKPSYGQAVSGIKVGILHLEHPTASITTKQMESLQYAIMAAVEDIPEGGPQVQFQSCTFRPGWLQVTCVNQESVSWLTGVVNTLQPWDGASLKCVSGDQLPKPHICVAYIPDEGSRRLTSEQVLTRLRKMNHGLFTLEWTVLHKEITGPGQTWTFAIDDRSMATLERIGFKPYLGFGQVVFRPKARPSQLASKPGPSKRSEKSRGPGPSGKPPVSVRRTDPPHKNRGSVPPARSRGTSHPKGRAGFPKKKTGNVSSTEREKRTGPAVLKSKTSMASTKGPKQSAGSAVAKGDQASSMAPTTASPLGRSDSGASIDPPCDLP